MANLEYVYVGSLWHEYFEPFVTIAAMTAMAAQVQLDDAERDELEYMASIFECHEHLYNEECKCKPEDDIMTGGIFKELVTRTDLTPEELVEVEEQGYCYLER